MKKLGKKGFTLIELIAVLVILAILALIVTPLVMNIVKKAKDASNRRSVDAYGKAMELAVATYLLDNGDYPDNLDSLTVEYSGNEVTCNTKILNDDGSIYLSECSVKNTEVLDSNNSDGYYHYGKTDKITLNDEYKIGDMIVYNGISFFVIEDSDNNSDSIKLITAEPLKSQDIIDLISSTESQSSIDTTGTYAKIPYYSSGDCVSAGTTVGCSTDYSVSSVKQLIDIWEEHYLTNSDLKEQSRLITLDELMNNLGYYLGQSGASHLILPSGEYTPSWVYSKKYNYWTMTANEENPSSINVVTFSAVDSAKVTEKEMTVRPVITLKKSSSYSRETYVKTYEVGDEVRYNNVDYYVIEDSDSDSDYVKLLKANALTASEINEYGAGHINEWNPSFASQGEAYDYGNVGGMAYYTSEQCGSYSGSSYKNDCTTEYNSSDVKYVIDNWSQSVLNGSDLKEQPRLITQDEVIDNFGFELVQTTPSDSVWTKTSDTPTFVYSNYWYWTMTPSSSNNMIVTVSNNGTLQNEGLNYDVNSNSSTTGFGAVRPVVTLYKSALNS